MGIQPIRKTVTPEIPDKLYFRIGDVARLCEVPAYVLRFWETEFPQLKPNKGGTGQRLYRRRDVEMALRIKSLLYDQGYTIPGARQVFKNEARPRETAPAEAVAAPAEAPASVMASAAQAGTATDSGAEQGFDLGAQIRGGAEVRERLQALRAEMRSLLEMLSRPAGSDATDGIATAAPKASPTPLRPRLVLEPRLKAAPRVEQQPLRLVKADQGDLFPTGE